MMKYISLIILYIIINNILIIKTNEILNIKNTKKKEWNYINSQNIDKQSINFAQNNDDISINLLGEVSVSSYLKISGTSSSFDEYFETWMNFGQSLLIIPDMNNDDINDILISSSNYNNNDGIIYIIYPNSNNNNDNDFIKSYKKINGDNFDQKSLFGYSMNIIDDINNDNINEIIVGAIGINDRYEKSGGIYIISLSNKSLLKTYIKFSATTNYLNNLLDAYDRFGYSISPLNDLNQDDINDIIVSAPYDDDRHLTTGAIYLLYLDYSTYGIKSYSKISATYGKLNHYIFLNTGDKFGSSVSIMSGNNNDLNNDGIQDIIVGSSGYDKNNKNDIGIIYILYLSTLGNVKSYTKITEHYNNFTTTLNTNDSFGVSISLISTYFNYDQYYDINNDGIQDIIIGSSNDSEKSLEDNNIDENIESGAIYILLLNNNDIINIKTYSKISRYSGYFTNVLTNYDHFGISIASYGDNLLNEGLIDIIVGANGDDDGYEDGGAVYVLSLMSSPTLAPTITPKPTNSPTLKPTNSPTFSPTKILHLRTIEINLMNQIGNKKGGFTGSIETNDYFGSSLTLLNDLDNDNIDDIIVGSNFDDSLLPNTGSIYIIFLKSNGNVKTYSKISFTALSKNNIPLSTNDNFGTSITTINDSSYTDIIVGTPGNDDEYKNSGAIYIILINTDGTIKTYNKISTTDDILYITSSFLYTNNRFGTSVLNINDINNDNINDIAVGSIFDYYNNDNSGAFYLLLLKYNREITTYIKISKYSKSSSTLLKNLLNTRDYFGTSLSIFGNENNDFNGDNIYDLIIGAQRDSSYNKGAIYILYFNQNNYIKTYNKINDIYGSFTAILNENDFFGSSISSLSTNILNEHYLDGNDYSYLLVGSDGYDGKNNDDGCFYILYLKKTGNIYTFYQISSNNNSILKKNLSTSDSFGSSILSFNNDFNNDGYIDIIIGADKYGGHKKGSIFILSLIQSPTISPTMQPRITKFPTIKPTIKPTLYPPTTLKPTINTLKPTHSPVKITPKPTKSPSTWSNIPKSNSIIISSSTKITKYTNGFTENLKSYDTFGSSISYYDDIDNNNVNELIIGMIGNDDEKSNSGCIYILFLEKKKKKTTNYNGEKKYIYETIIKDNKYIKYSASTSTYLNNNLSGGDRFGWAITKFNDINNDNINEIIISAPYDDDLNTDSGAIYILYIKSNGNIKTFDKISGKSGSFTAILKSDHFGSSVSKLNDLNNDNINDIIVGADYTSDITKNYDYSDYGAIYILYLKDKKGIVKSYSKLSIDSKGFTIDLVAYERFGTSITLMNNENNDLNGDNYQDIAVGTAYGIIYIIFLNGFGKVDTYTKISSTSGSFTASYFNDNINLINDNFGCSLSWLESDLNGDNIEDLVVGADYDDDGGNDRGAIYILMPYTTGVIITYSKISSTYGSFNNNLNDYDYFGNSIGLYGGFLYYENIDGSKWYQITVGACKDDQGNTNSGAIYILTISQDGSEYYIDDIDLNDNNDDDDNDNNNNNNNNDDNNNIQTNNNKKNDSVDPNDFMLYSNLSLFLIIIILMLIRKRRKVKEFIYYNIIKKYFNKKDYKIEKEYLKNKNYNEKKDHIQKFELRGFLDQDYDFDNDDLMIDDDDDDDQVII